MLVTNLSVSSGVPGGGFGGSNPPPRNFEGPPKSYQTKPDCENLKIAEFWTLTPQNVRKKCSKILKLPSVRNCFTLAMTNKLVVIINSLKVTKIKKILLYETSCIKSQLPPEPLTKGPPPPRSPFSLSPLSSTEFVEPPRAEFLVTPLSVSSLHVFRTYAVLQ